MDQELNALEARLKQGDRDAFSDLYRITAPKLFGIAHHLVGDPITARNVLKSVYGSVWAHKGLTDSAPGNSFLDGLMAFTRREAFAALNTPHADGMSNNAALLNDPIIRRTLRTSRRPDFISEEDWELVALVHLNRHSTRNVSEMLGQTEEYVEERIRSVIRQILEAERS